MAARSSTYRSPARKLGLKGRRSLMASPQSLRYALPSGDLINAILQYADVSQDMGGGQRSAPGDHIPPLAQLKLLRVLEADVKQQLLDFRKDHPDVAKLDETAKNVEKSDSPV